MIKSTKDYSIFKKKELNRCINQTNLRKIMNSIQSRNMLEFRPILCDSKMYVIDGQHRLQAAKELGLEIYYQVDSDASDENMILLNANSFAWKLDDYIHYYMKQGNEEYIKLYNFAEKTEMSCSEIIAFSALSYASSSYQVKSGNYSFLKDEELLVFVENMEKVQKIRQTIERFSIGEFKFRTNKKFTRSAFSFVSRSDVNFEVMLKKITLKLDSLRPCTNCQGYYIMLRDIYNYKNQNPVD